MHRGPAARAATCFDGTGGEAGDHDLAAAVLGVSPARYKIIAFGISSFFAGVAGAMYAFKATYITIDPPFNLNMSVEFIAIIVIGGATPILGAILGALFFGLVRPLAESLANRFDLLDALPRHSSPCSCSPSSSSLSCSSSRAGSAASGSA